MNRANTPGDRGPADRAQLRTPRRLRSAGAAAPAIKPNGHVLLDMPIRTCSFEHAFQNMSRIQPTTDIAQAQASVSTS
ncbi:hypothetical protein [Nannocystis sp. SCPEA4]|uniref:hypothetical protein n=1 Tax=Nannocystis sp. SCPEA4 TaxID=2996787 RepID=UPI00226F28D6|nr:hypothetical protein [Nannocystis sp. SCPEA4]MCY1055759.1 hypothetical protein [Nannocystis sp. SCPEA4]